MAHKKLHHRPRSLVPILLVAALVGLPATAQAACELSIQPLQDQLVIRHNPLEETLAGGTIEVRITNRGDTACTGRIGTTLNGEPFGFRSGVNSQVIPYQLVDEKGRADVTPRAGLSLAQPTGGVIRLAPGEQSLEIVSIVARPGDLISHGLYTQSLELTVVDLDGTILGARPLTLGVEIVPSATIGIKGQVSSARRSNEVNLGELSQGVQEIPLIVYVNSTGGYRVDVSSENQGRLKHESSVWYIPYRLRMGEHDLRLSGIDGFEVVSDEARRDNYRLQINIGDTSNKRAGSYSDTVTFTIAAI